MGQQRARGPRLTCLLVAVLVAACGRPKTHAARPTEARRATSPVHGGVRAASSTSPPADARFEQLEDGEG